MPIRYQIELPRRLIRTQGTGSVTSEEVTQHLRQLEVDPQFQKPLDVLLDLTACTSLPNRNQLEEVAKQLASLGLGEHFKTGQRWSGENRPTERLGTSVI